MKFDNISRLLWSAILVMITTAGTNSNVLVSAAPVVALSSGSDAPTPTVHTAISDDRPGSYSTQVDHPVVIQVIHRRQGEEDDDDLRHRFGHVMEWYVRTQDVKICNRAKSDVESVDEDEDSETEGNVEFSKRRMQVYGTIRYVNLADIRKRDYPSTSATIASEEESKEGVTLFKRRMGKSGQVQTVHPDDYMKRDLPYATTTPGDEQGDEPESVSESANEFVSKVDLSKRKQMPNSWVRWISPSDFNQRDLPSTTSTFEYESKSESKSEIGAYLSKRRMRANETIRYVKPDHYKKREDVPSTAHITTTIAVEGILRPMVEEVKAGEGVSSYLSVGWPNRFSVPLSLEPCAWNK
ncbi:hypothetical protein EC957_000379 [Mortierella hygrophila]|uniref:Uncharacterized protein n=1 Tax=Mortierella hygrophila TaxID=979708 RepID=A0A9P6K348_9FUNG|nr:hypothetical protein EC957_000379 [Mortierella hygrophila]